MGLYGVLWNGCTFSCVACAVAYMVCQLTAAPVVLALVFQSCCLPILASMLCSLLATVTHNMHVDVICRSVRPQQVASTPLVVDGETVQHVKFDNCFVLCITRQGHTAASQVHAPPSPA
jgi:hypothetical protein